MVSKDTHQEGLDLKLDQREKMLASIYTLLLKLEMRKLPLVLLWGVVVEVGVLDEALEETLEILRWR